MSPSPVKPAIDFVPLLQCLKVMYIWSVLQDLDRCVFIYIHVASYSNRYAFRKVYATDVLFSPLYRECFLVTV